MASVNKQDKETQERNKRTLRQLLEQPGNEECMDCTAKAPTWASINLGIFVCPRCSGLHRQMGTHISQVRSTTLDLWEPGWISTMRKMGNANAKMIYEARLPKGYDKPGENENADTMLEWLRMKYEHKKYYASKQSPTATKKTVKQQKREQVQRQLGNAFSTSSSESSPDASPRVQQEVSTSESESDDEPAPASPGRQRGRSFKDFLFEGMDMSSNRPPAVATTTAQRPAFDPINSATSAQSSVPALNLATSPSAVPAAPLLIPTSTTPTLLPLESTAPVSTNASVFMSTLLPPEGPQTQLQPILLPIGGSSTPTLLPSAQPTLIPSLIPLDVHSNSSSSSLPVATLLPNEPSQAVAAIVAAANRPRTLSALKAESDVKKGIIPAQIPTQLTSQDDIFSTAFTPSASSVPPKNREAVKSNILDLFATEEARRHQANRGTGPDNVPFAVRAGGHQSTPAAGSLASPALGAFYPGLDLAVKSAIDFMKNTGCPPQVFMTAIMQNMFAGVGAFGGVAAPSPMGNGAGTAGYGMGSSLLPPNGVSPTANVGESAANAALTAALSSSLTAPTPVSATLLSMINNP